MPVFYSPTPKNLHMVLASVSGSVFTNNRTGDFSSDYNREQDDKTLVSHLPLQMLLYFNIFQFPCWFHNALFSIYSIPKSIMPLLVTGVVLLTICEITRLYLGYIGTLKEKVTEANFLSGTSSLEQWRCIHGCQGKLNVHYMTKVCGHLLANIP
uniref:Uncharacterized protein n=1 Tax=Oncorhynchus mykiss TaxID=8022 RepID=A0A8C7UEW2_ONCMY